MTKLKVNQKYHNYKLSSYIQTLIPNTSISSIKKAINNGNIKVNGQKVYDNHLIKVNDELTIFLNIKKPNQNYLKTKIKVPIFYEDENIIIFDKPIGISCQENKNEKFNTLNNFLKKYCFSKKEWNGFDKENEPCLIHRLDQNTMGLIIAAKNKSIARLLNKDINYNFTKKYLTIIYGKTTKSHATLIDYIIKDKNAKNKMIVTKKPIQYSSKIITKYSTLFSDEKYSILEVELLTGKKHQIRAHLAFHKMYIIGDSKYGIKNKNLKLKNHILIANYLKFNIKNEKLKYLNSKEFIKIKDFKSILNLIR